MVLLVLFALLTISFSGMGDVVASSTVDIDNTTVGGIKGAIDNGNDTVNLASGVYSSDNRCIEIASGSDVKINGKGSSPNDVKIDGKREGYMFTVNDNSNLTLSNITFTNYYATDDDGVVIRNLGGVVVLKNCLFLNNQISGYKGGVIYNEGGDVSIFDCTFNNNTASSISTGTHAFGGVIYSLDGTVNIQKSTFTNNKAVEGGVLYTDDFNHVSINDSTFINNTATGTLYNATLGGGGAIYNYNNSELSVVNSRFSSNYAKLDGGAIYNAVGNFTIINSSFISNYVTSATGKGGAIYNMHNGTFNMSNSNFTSNYAFYGGAITNYNGDFNITNSKFISNYVKRNGTIGGQGGAIYIWNYGNTTIDSSIFQNNNASEGGAIYNIGSVNLNQSNFTKNNVVYFGGAILNYVEGILVIDGSIFSDNLAGYDGGAIYNTGGANSTNGTILVGANCSISNSKFYRNSAVNRGGAIINLIDQFGYYNGTLIVSNSEFINNTAHTYDGGAIYNSGIANIESSNFTKNTGYNGGALFNEFGLLNVAGSIFTNNVANNRGGALYSKNGKFNISYSALINNKDLKNYQLYDADTSVDSNSAEYNWWGTNTPTSTTNRPYFGISISKYYVMKLTTSTANGTLSTGDKINVTYSFVLNGTNDSEGADKFQGFLTPISLNGREVQNIQGNINGTYEVIVSAKLSNITMTVTTDNLSTVRYSATAGSSKIVIGNFSGRYNQVIKVNATLLDKNDNPIVGKTINFYIKGILVGTGVTNSEGIAILNYKCNITGTNSITANLTSDNGDYLPSSNSSTIVITKTNTKISIAKFTASYDNPVQLKATLLDSAGSPIKGKSISFYVNNVLVKSAVTDVNGIAIISYTHKAIGNFQVLTKFNGDIDANTSSNNSVLKVSKSNVVMTFNNQFIIAYNQIGILTATLKSPSGGQLVNKLVTFYVSGKKVGSARTNSEGIANLRYKSTVMGNRALKATFAGDSYYNTINKSSKLTTSKSKTTTTLAKFKAYYKKKVTLKATLKDQGLKIIKSKYIRFYVKGKYVGKAKTSSKGVAYFKYAPKFKGKGSFIAKFAGDSKYHNSKYTRTINVKAK